MADPVLGDQIPEFGSDAKSSGNSSVGVTNLSAFRGSGEHRSKLEIAAIIAVAVLIVGGLEFLIRFFEVPEFVFPPPSSILTALVTEFP